MPAPGNLDKVNTQNIVELLCEIAHNDNKCIIDGSQGLFYIPVKYQKEFLEEVKKILTSDFSKGIKHTDSIKVLSDYMNGCNIIWTNIDYAYFVIAVDHYIDDRLEGRFEFRYDAHEDILKFSITCENEEILLEILNTKVASCLFSDYHCELFDNAKLTRSNVKFNKGDVETIESGSSILTRIKHPNF